MKGASSRGVTGDQEAAEVLWVDCLYYCDDLIVDHNLDIAVSEDVIADVECAEPE